MNTKAIAITVFGTILSLACIGAWAYVAPGAGSGWILFVAFLGSLGVLTAIEHMGLRAVAGTVITLAAAAAWYTHRAFDDGGWVLGLAILCALGTFTALKSVISESTATQARDRDSE